MFSEMEFIEVKKLRVKGNKSIKLSDYSTDYHGEILNKKLAEDLLELGRSHLTDVQEKLYAQNRYGVLIIFQAMDAAGKDSAVKHIMSGFNPAGVRVHSFKTPTPHELDHHYLWRHYLALPGRGEIAIHNRSHYENVLVTRVHPEYILNERLPGIDAVDKIKKKFWDDRLKQIIQFEKTLNENGTLILKFFLHISKDEQKKRFLDRINDSTKHWKYSSGDLKERALWDKYQEVYEKTISATSKKQAPWFIIPADDKWYARLAIAAIISQYFEDLNIAYPKVTESQKLDLAQGRQQLMAEPSPGSPSGKVKKIKR